MLAKKVYWVDSLPLKLAVLVAAASILLLSCSDNSDAEGDLNTGGSEPPPGFQERVDANCRAAAAEIAALSDIPMLDAVPTVRRLNGQSLLRYTLADGGTAQCAVSHTDESVIDMRVIGSE